MKSNHTPVMLNETIDLLNVKKDGFYVDMTFGGGGHSRLILEKLDGTGKLISFDLYEKSLEIGKELEKANKNFNFYNDNYKNYFKYIDGLGSCDGIIADLGLSTDSIESSRGFSYMNNDEELDMRYSMNHGTKAYSFINNSAKKTLEREFKIHDVPSAKKLVDSIDDYKRMYGDIKTTGDLLGIINLCYGENLFFKVRKIIFQAIRMIINQELLNIKQILKSFETSLKVSGVFCALCFNSLERDLVFKRMKTLAKETQNTLPIPDSSKIFELLTKRPIRPTIEEVEMNSKAASAYLLAIRRVR